MQKEKISIVIQYTGAIILIINLLFVMKLSRLIDEDNNWLPGAAMFLTAFYLPLINWSLQGMEVSLAALITTVSVYWALKLYLKKEFSPWIFLFLGVATLLRIDMAVVFIGVSLFLINVLPGQRKNNILWSIIFFAAFIGGQTVFRIVYYGDILPNTYYLKMTGYPLIFRITRGIDIFIKFIWNLNIFLFALPFIVLSWRFDIKRAFIAWMFGLQCLYSIYVGGDAWEVWGGSNRYISIVMPLFFVLFAHGLAASIKYLIESINKTGIKYGKIRDVYARYALSVILVLSFLYFNNNNGPLSFAGYAFINKPANVEGGTEVTKYAYIIRDITTTNAKIAVTWAGALPYFSERYTVDILGKTDKKIAHMEMRRVEGLKQLTFFYPGHLKYDYAHSFGECQPDVIVQFWENADEAWPYIEGKYTKLVVGDWFFYLKNGSPEILWEKLPPMDVQHQ